MTAGQAIGAGLREARRNAWMVVLFYACNLALAAAVAAPMYTAIRDHVGRSGMGEELVRGFSHQWLQEFQIAYDGFLKGFSIAMVYAGVLFLLLNAVLSAGAFEVFTRGAGAGMHAFGRGMGKFFVRFLKLAAAASVMYFACFFLFQYAGDKGLDWLFRRSATERWHYYLDWLRWGLLFFSVFVVSAAVEYAKADLVRDEHDSVLAALGHAGGLVWARWGTVMAIYLTLGAMATVTILIYAMFARYFPQSSVATVLVWFVVAQALLGLRWYFRLASWAAAVEYLGASREVKTPG